MEGQFNEKIAFKEILIYLKNSRDKNSFLKFLEEIGGETKVAIDEINKWVKENFKTESIFTILGI